jgi:hypothetical protein
MGSETYGHISSSPDLILIPEEETTKKSTRAKEEKLWGENP